MKLILPAHLGEVIRRAQGGSSEAIKEVAELCRVPLLKFSARLIPSSVRPLYDADDCVIETLIEILREHYREEILSDREHLEWRIKKTAANNVRDACKKYHRDTENRELVCLEYIIESLWNRSSPEETAIESEFVANLQARTQRMPEEVQRIVTLWQEGVTPAHIAVQLGVNLRRVHRWLRALEKMVRK